MKSYIYLIALFLFAACEKDISVNYAKPPTQLVVEGHIEQGYPPYVIITHNLDIYSQLDTNSIKELTVSKALVEVSDGFRKVYLTEVRYGNESVYVANNMIGEVGKTYKLRIKTGTYELFASTYLPKPIPLDSVRFSPIKGNDSLGLLKCFLKDPDTLGNYYRYFVKRLGKDNVDFVTKNLNSNGTVFEDKVINGQQFDFEIDRPPSQTEESDPNESSKYKGYFKRGDVIVFKWCTLDKDHFEFWRTLQRSQNSAGNPFSSPQDVKSNIIGGLGIWGAYGASYDTLVVE